MSESQWTKVGKIKDAHGLRGDLYVLIFSKDISWAKEIEHFAVAPMDQEQNKKTFKIEKIKGFKDGVMIKAQGVQDRTQAEALRGQMFYLPADIFESDEGETIYLKEIQGFQVHDQDGNVLGPILDFSTNTIQDLLVVELSTGKKVEIPFVEDFILEIDFASKVVHMDLPEGLLDL